MNCKYVNEIRKRAKSFFNELNKIGLKGELTSTEGEYFMRANITNAGEEIGFVDIYYKPSKGTYSILPNGRMIDSDRQKVITCFKGQAPKLPASQPQLQSYADKGIEIDVDGSYRNGKASFAAIIRKDGAVIDKLSGEADPTSHQINGELQAVLEALKWCEKRKYMDVTIYHDLEHSGKFATGSWKPQTEFGKNYVKILNDSKINVKWIKVPSHKGYKWNENTDKLAKSVLT